MKIACVVGARPNFMKMGPVVLELMARGNKPTLVHTGQHYDANMSKVFFDELGLPAPDVSLGVGSGSHAKQTGAVMLALEELWSPPGARPDLVIVAGDVNSTMAASLVAAKLLLPLAHVEAGLRSFDRTMPEEVNRVVTDVLSDLLFTTEPSGDANLAREGIDKSKVHRVGNCMIDTLLRHKERALASAPWEALGVKPGGYGVVTLHRPANVDDEAALARTMAMLGDIARELPLIFPVHPRTRARLGAAAATDAVALAATGPVRNILLVEPLPYLAFTGLMARAALVLTDSGGVQEETTAFGVPCVTMRDNTERPITVDVGTNVLAGTDTERVARVAKDTLRSPKPGRVPELWDGKAAGRVVDVIERWGAGRS